MPALALHILPNPSVIGLLDAPQLCYALVSISAAAQAGARPVNWALVADASRSMRIPIVDEAQFRTLVRQGGAQETLVDGVPVWQLAGPVPQDVRAASRSALDYVAHALHTVVERLDNQDRFALVACAEEALLLVRSTPGNDRAALVNGIARLKSLNLGEQTDLAQGLALALQELRRGRDAHRVERLLLLTDGFTQRPEACAQLAAAAAAEGVTISTVGLGGEFQDDVLTMLADQSGGRALFLRHPNDIPSAIAQELALARAAAARALTLRIAPAPGVLLRRATRIRPVLAILYDSNGTPGRPGELHLGDLPSGATATLLLEFLAPPRTAGAQQLADLALLSEGAAVASAAPGVRYQADPPPLPAEVLDAAARVSVARLQQRAASAAAAGAAREAARLLRTAATRLDALGEPEVARVARDQALALERSGHTTPLATKELTYATRRLGESQGNL